MKLEFSIDHLGIAVKSLAAAKSIYEKLGLSVSPEETVEAERVRLVMVPVGESRLELLEATADDSTIARFIAKHGEGLHHVCMRVPDLAAAVAKLKRDGVRLVSNEIKTGAGGHRYVFVHPQSTAGVLLELVEEKNRVIGPSGHRRSRAFDFKLPFQRMLILAVDTSGKQGSIALAECETGRCAVIEMVPLTGGTFSAQLVPQIATLLEKHGHTKSDLGGFAVASGPGSFTGLRVGLAAIKALAEVLDKPIAAVSLLEAVAWSANLRGAARGRVHAALDAGRGDVYAGNYELDPDTPARIRMYSERLLSRDEFIAEATGKALVTPDATLAEIARAAGIPVERIEYANSGVIARLGWEHLQRGETVSPEELEANYIRRSDAEIFAKPVR